jgi:phosphoglycolate phosphatase
MAIRLIIIDLDGTLADTAADTADALNEALLPFKAPSFSVEEAKAAMGGGEDRIMERLFKETGLDWLSFRNRFAAAYAARLTARTRLYPGVIDTLKKLSSLRKVVMSNKREALTVKILDHFGILPYFDAIVGGDSGGGRKPSPGPILEILSQFQEKPEKTIMVGDCIYDIEAGHAAGIRTVAVTYGYGVDDFARKADFVIDAFPQLVDIVEGSGES